MPRSMPPRKTAHFLIAAMLVTTAGARAAEQSGLYDRIVDARVAYSAEMVLSNGARSFAGKIVHRPGVTRTEFGKTVTIHDHRTEKWLQFRVGQKRYLILSARGQAKAPYMPPRLKRADIRVQTVGRETVAGEPTSKIKLSFPTGELTLWQTNDGIVVKMDGTATVRRRKQSVTMVLKNLKRGPQDAALFAPPPGTEPLNPPTTPKKKTGPRKTGGKKKAATTK